MKPNFRKLDSIWAQGAAITATVVCLVTPAFKALSQGGDTLVITENSATSLSVLWNGGSITPTFIANDHWTFTLPVAAYLGGGGGVNGDVILEPGAGVLGPYNNIFGSALFATTFDVQSDSPTTQGTAQPINDGVASTVGSDISGNRITITFHDAGDTVPPLPGVPDTGSTAALLACAFGLLAGLRRKMAV